MKDSRRRRKRQQTRRISERKLQQARVRRWKRGRNCWKRRRRIMRGCRKVRVRNRQKRQPRGNKREVAQAGNPAGRRVRRARIDEATRGLSGLERYVGLAHKARQLE